MSICCRGAEPHPAVAVPLPLDLEMGSRARVDCLDRIMRDVGVDAGLQERVKRRRFRGKEKKEPREYSLE